jgi:hypothetical protein
MVKDATADYSDEEMHRNSLGTESVSTVGT